MKSIDKRWILFLTLIILLASGLTFLALNQEASSKKEENRDPKMAVALVNEDEGAVFNGEDLAFGDAFVKSMDKNNNHDWYIVSRGVAESGLTNNTYDMMIVIPNNFSQKALSIESENPEQVVLDYKINATDNEKIKAEAEKTASNILNEFNQRIIDVFFASILNNLQGAQTNIGDIIDKQSQLTNTYNNQIYGRLNNYTDQFGMIKDNTEISKDSFSGFEDKLENYENELAEDAERNQNYLSSLEEVFQMQETNTTTWQNFYEAFNQFDTTLNASEVEGQLQELQAANLAINKQFQTREEQPKTPSVNTVMFRQSSNNVANIASGTAALKKHLDESLTKVERVQKDLETKLNPDHPDGFTGKVSDRLSAILDNAFDDDDQLNINKLFENPDRNAKEHISKQIANLPTLNEDQFGDEGLPNQTVTEIQNVIAVTKKYNDEFEYTAPEGYEDVLLSHQMKELKTHLHTNGLTMTDSVGIPKNEKSAQEFILNIPTDVLEKFSVTQLVLSLPGKGEIDRTEEYKKNKKIILPANREGNFQVNVTLQLKDVNTELDIFKPISWGWNLHQKDIKNVDNPETASIQMANTPLIASTSANGQMDKQKSETEDSKQQTKEEGSNQTSSPEKEKTETDNEKQPNSENNDGKPEEGSSEYNDNNDRETGSENEDPKPDEGDDQPGGVEDEEEPPVEKLKVIDNHITHQIMTPMDDMDNATEHLINAVNNTIAPYQKLFSTYESYLGLDMGHENLRADLEDQPLKDLATKTSLYYLFNEKEIGDLLKDYVVDQIVGDISKEIQKPLQTLKSQIDDHQQRVQQAYQNADQLVKKVEATSKKAKVLNTNLASTLEDVSKWRERSQTLIEQQTEIQANEDGENTAIMSLGNEFEPLLTASQSLAEQTQGNLNAAENVYDTFDTIDNHAETIQESGVNLVDQAEELSVNMTNKLVEDQEFANNFTNVLANSQIGERENENLYEFLSNPVQVSNNGTITSPTGNTFNPYYLVLICFIVVLFTAYVISTINQKRVEQDQFTEEKSLMAANTPITMITAGIGVLEGIIIGVLSSYFLEISNVNMLLWITVVTTVTVAMLLIATYLLRQLKMIGMFLLLAIFSIYLFLTNTLGSGSEAIQMIREFSPLKLVESVLRNTVQGDMNYSVTLVMIIGLIVLGAVGNLFVTHQLRNKGDIDDESSEEAS
ncbi:hypothetical protein M948_16795 [Virgibacillus sp. CM-4]|uniref:type VII secretion protein EsaA n=1 Tax=Virgibacillus sp. CM-4 TaxID=1354277 RepID=UPI00038885F8|nr:type VII secretion protein EsaA [Virgibacillus sp. CM-4]EQB36690.1 hypothetical protein M948_16795 [Virgibacillus sp. CM-4]